MVIFEQSFRDLLITTGLFQSRVFLMKAPQVPADLQKIPYCVFLPVGALPRWTMKGPLQPLQRDYQVSIFDTSQSTALALADALRTSFDTLHGDFEGVRFGSMFFMAQTWQYENDTELFHVIQEYRIQFQILNGQPAVSNPQSLTRPKIRNKGVRP